MKEWSWWLFLGAWIWIGGFVLGAVIFSKNVDPAHSYTVETFTSELTIRIQCSGNCDLAVMIAEAREAATK